MIELGVCVETVFPKLPFLERIKKVARIGISGN